MGKAALCKVGVNLGNPQVEIFALPEEVMSAIYCAEINEARLPPALVKRS